MFAPDGRIRNRGIKFLKRVRRGGVDPSIRAEVWPFLLGVYGLDTTKDERDVIRTQNRKKYEKLWINTFLEVLIHLKGTKKKMIYQHSMCLLICYLTAKNDVIVSHRPPAIDF